MTPDGNTVSDSGQQHVQMFRKLLLRRRMMRWAVDGAVYVPFIGDGDIAAECYRDRAIFGADLDPVRVATAQDRLTGDIRIADCDSWPFPGVGDKFAVADFDAYVDPYVSFRSFWSQANHHDRLVLFFTDGRRQGLERSGSWTKPDGTKVRLRSGPEKAAVFNFYLGKHVWPWFDDFIKPWRVLDRMRYLRSMMLYWGVAIERPQG